MKLKRTLGILFGSLLLVASTGCGHFSSLMPPELKDIEIVADPYKSFVKDDKFEDCADLKLVGHYSDKTTKILNKTDVELIYINNETGVGYSIDKEIPASGEYSLRARYQGITSTKTFDFSAVQNHIYASTIEVDDLSLDNSQLYLGPKKSQILSFTVEPLDYTEEIKFAIKDESVISVTRLDSKRFEITALKDEGETDLYFYAFNTPKQTFIDLYFRLIIGEVFVSSMKANGPTVMYKNSKAAIILGVSPSNFTVDITPKHLTGILDIDQVDKCTFEITALKCGVAEVTFIAKRSFNDYIQVTHRVVVSEKYATKISASGKGTVNVNSTIKISLEVTPADFSVDTYAIVSKANVVDYKKINNMTYEVTGKSSGEVDLYFYVASGNNTIVFCVHHIEVKHVYVRSISLLGPSTIRVGERVKYTLVVEPFDYTVKMHYRSDHEEIVTVEKQTDNVYILTGISNGYSYVSFYADKNDLDYCVCDRYITVKYYPDFVGQSCYDFVSRNGKNEAPVPSIGDIKMLVIPIWFEDSASFFGGEDANHNKIDVKTAKQNLLDDIKLAFGGMDGNRTIDWESVASFYNDESQQQLTITPVYSDFYDHDESSTEFDGERDPSLIKKDRNLVKKAVNKFFDDHKDEDRTTFDYDEDGYIDAVAIIYIAPSNANSTKENLWSFKYCVSDKSVKNVNKPGPNMYMWASYDRMYDQTQAKARLGTDAHHLSKVNGENVDARVYIHEVGHMFGLKDLYDGGGGEGLETADFTGGRNMQTTSRCSHDPFSLMALKWAFPYVPTNSCTINLGDFQTTREFIMLTPKYNSNFSPFDEYMLLEFYNKTGLNAQNGLDASGIRLWHINAKLYNRETKKLTTDATESKCIFAFNNSLNLGTGSEQINEDYIHYSQVHLIRKNPSISLIVGNPVPGGLINIQTLQLANSVSYASQNPFAANDLFVQGDSFKMENYASQFVRYYVASLSDSKAKATDYATLDSGKRLGWEFIVENLTKSTATIRLTKVA